jgi:uncharacterized protein
MKDVPMRLDKLIQTLLPHNTNFYLLFEEATTHIVAASNLLRQFPETPHDQRGPLISGISDEEHACDAVTHRIYAELNSTFVTPFDPEDIHTLASALDDVLDLMDGCARRFQLYQIKECSSVMQELMEMLHLSVLELQRGVRLLRNLEKPKELQAIILKINEYENAADAIFDQAIASLFNTPNDPIEIIKMKEIFVTLETATDKCEDAANVIESILIKHA